MLHKLEAGCRTDERDVPPEVRHKFSDRALRCVNRRQREHARLCFSSLLFRFRLCFRSLFFHIGLCFRGLRLGPGLCFSRLFGLGPCFGGLFLFLCLCLCFSSLLLGLGFSFSSLFNLCIFSYRNLQDRPKQIVAVYPAIFLNKLPVISSTRFRDMSFVRLYKKRFLLPQRIYCLFFSNASKHSIATS